uniref:Acetylglutamate kinase n=1 Tax=Galaxaura rugosa TaxID=268570 RepID=A0A1G4NT29_9FLOR|nr:Acetylglutamate kinase [Galaxaura rugosa]SCW21833.1 Acetylglutamate kinase [Galaxaura rugosa]
MNDSSSSQFLNKVLPLIINIQNKTVVIKYGGSAMQDKRLTQQVIQNIALLIQLGIKVVVVHGGGPLINYWLEKFQMKAKFHNGLRVTDPETMQIVEMVLVGKVNKNLVALLNNHKCQAIGVSGQDANLIIADPLDTFSNDRVGKVKTVNIDLITSLLKNQYTPVIAPLACDSRGISYNINADIVAGEIAGSIAADVLIMLTDTPGILSHQNDVSSLINCLTVNQVFQLIDDKTIQGGMLPKVHSCIQALSCGTRTARIIDGRIPDSILKALFLDQCSGTSIIS